MRPSRAYVRLLAYACRADRRQIHVLVVAATGLQQPARGPDWVAIRVGWPLPISSYEKAQRARRAFANKFSVTGDSSNSPRTCRENERAIRPKLGNDVAKLGGECAAGLLIEGRGK